MDQFKYNVRNRISGFITIVRLPFFILTPLNAASAAVLALQEYPSLIKCVLGFFAVAFASCAINVFNDYIDRERDKLIWPNRPIPSGRVKSIEALFIAIFSLIISLSIAWFSFNITTFLILLMAMLLGILYSVFLRDRVGYLSLPPIVGLIYLGGWTAFSPDTLFNNFLPWYLYLIGVVWQAGHIMVYYPLHVPSGGGGSEDNKVPPVFFTKPSLKTIVYIGTGSIFVTLLLSALLPLMTQLGVVYITLVLISGCYALYRGIALVIDPSDGKRALKAFTWLTIFRLTISASILIQIFIYVT